MAISYEIAIFIIQGFFLIKIFIWIFTRSVHQTKHWISEEVSEGSYANLAIITHSQAEFIVDFVNVMPGTPKE